MMAKINLKKFRFNLVLDDICYTLTLLNNTDWHTSSVPHVSSSLVTSHVLIRPWTTAEHSDPAWPPYRGTGTADQADLTKLGSTQLNLMSLYSTLVWQLPIIKHKTGRHGGCSWKWQSPLDRPQDDDNKSRNTTPAEGESGFKCL